MGVGFVLFFLNTPLLKLSPVIGTFLYILTISLGYIALLMAGVWMSRLLRTNLMDDVFNNENESFQQETKLMENEYSVNLPTKFYYKGQMEQRLDKHCKSFQGINRVGYSGFRKILCNRKQLHQAAD